MRNSENEEILQRINNIEKKITEVDFEVKEIKSDTKDLVTTFRSLTGFLNVVDFLYKISKPLIWFVLVCAAVYYFFIGLKLPMSKM